MKGDDDRKIMGYCKARLMEIRRLMGRLQRQFNEFLLSMKEKGIGY